MKPRSYEDAGVSIQRGDSFATYLASHASRAMGSLGGFAGGMEIDLARYRRPVLLTTTDGVGTKLLVARALGRYDTVGVDLVAMCVNDLAVCGAQPSLFLDYIACGAIDDSQLRSVMDGIIRGCEEAGCTLAGGETAELPDMYGPGDVDLAGFAVGLVEHDQQLPRRDDIAPGDRLVGLASSGVHSNGFSLARKLFSEDDTPALEMLLTPTRIYVRQLMAALPYIKAAAHITGGGLEANTRRVLSDGLELSVSWAWPVPDVFGRIQAAGSIDQDEMRRVFNMGIGIVMVAPEESLAALEHAVGEPLVDVGSVVRG